MPAAETVRRFIEQGQLDEAAALLDHLDEGAERHHLAGVLALHRNRPEAAAGHFTAALAAVPGHAGYLCNLGVAERRRGNLAAAIAAYAQALACDPERAEAAFNLANVLSEQGRPEAALAAYRRALVTAPEWPQFHYNRANLLNLLDRLDEAVGSYVRLLRLTAGRHGDAWINLGKVAEKQGRVDFALRCFEHVLAADPNNVSARWNRALVLLLTGRWSEGWREYEWRWRLAASPPRTLPAPAWQGEAGEGRTLLLHAEQGLGDTLHFIRYLPLAAARGFRVVAEVQEPLVRLVAASFPEVVVVPQGAALPPFDRHAPLMSLPGLFGTTVKTVPAAIPYLRPPPDVTAPSLPGRGLRIGISWGGDPRHKNDGRRSIPLKRLLPALNVAGLSLFSLQKGPKAEELGEVDGITDLGSGFNDLADTAAALAGLDLVISVDTAIAHLAGALGRPVWILLPFAPDWRWLRDTDASPWYPTARLFRQPAPGAWDAALDLLSASLRTLPRP